MSSPNQTSYCFRCQYQPKTNEAPLKQCSRCHLRRYCSQQCQRNDWDNHKNECRIIAAGGVPPARVRTTMRMNLSEFLGNDAEPRNEIDPDTIYYLKTVKPHLHDVSISGPFYPFENIIEQILYRLKIEKSLRGEDNLKELVRHGTLMHLEHFTAPLEDGNILRFHLLKEHNPEVARHLPGVVWNVCVATPLLTNEGQPIAPSGDYVPLEDMVLHATFLTKLEANTAATRLLDGLKERADPMSRVTRKEVDGLVYGFLHPRPNSQAKPKFVQVNRDDGQGNRTQAG